MSASQTVDLNVQLSCTDKDDHVVVRADGDWTVETFRHIVDFARAEALAHGTHRILLDMRAVSRPDSAYTRYLGGLYIAHTMGSRYRIAAIGEADNVTHYGETVARNRGSDLMAFSDEERAIYWLMR